MYQVDLPGFIKGRNLDQDALADVIFADLGDKKHAMWRLMNGRNNGPSAELIAQVANFAGVHPGELYTLGPWKGTVDGRVHILTGRNFRAEIDARTKQTKLHHISTGFCKELATPLGVVTAQEFLDYLEDEASQFRPEA